MSEHTNIEWCDSTINPTSGCDGCEILGTCYARGVHENRLAKSFPDKYGASFLEVRMIAGRMQQAARWRDLRGTARKDKPWLNGMPRMVFISDMADALSKTVTFEFLQREIVDVVRGWKHIGLWLTKRPERMAEFDRWLGERGETWPVNLWAGTSVTSQRAANWRVGNLLKVRAGLHFLSVEPLLLPLDLTDIVEPCGQGTRHFNALSLDGDNPEDDEDFCGRLIRWVICGGESGPKARAMHPDWVRALRDQCVGEELPFFFKQWGSWVPAVDNIERYTLRPQGGNAEYCRALRRMIKAHRATDCTDRDFGYRENEFLFRRSKEASGAVLDGREWRGMPAVATITGGGDGRG